MGLLRLFAILFAVLLVAIGGFYAWMGGFASVSVTKGPWGPVEIAIGAHRGPYKDLGESWAVFNEKTIEAGLADCDGLAVYLDPPDTDPEALRTILGCRIDDLDDATKAALRQTLPVVTLPASDAYLAEFPYKNELSYVLGPMKVYPAMTTRFEADGVTPSIAVEVYGRQGAVERIQFVLPVGVDPAAIAPLYAAFE